VRRAVRSASATGNTTAGSRRFIVDQVPTDVEAC
jgi:hypothetical protein